MTAANTMLVADVRVPSLIAYLSSTSYAQHHSFLAAPLDASSTGDLVGAFNILFFPSPLPILEQATAVDLVGSLLCANLKAPALPSNGQSRRRDTGQSSQDQSGSVLRRWLFPEPSDAKQQKAVRLDVDIGNDSWIDPGLNEEQRVRKAICESRNVTDAAVALTERRPGWCPLPLARTAADLWSLWYRQDKGPCSLLSVTVTDGR